MPIHVSAATATAGACVAAGLAFLSFLALPVVRAGLDSAGAPVAGTAHPDVPLSVPELRAVPDSLPFALHAQMSQKHAALEVEIKDFLVQAAEFNADAAQTDARYTALLNLRSRLIRRVNAFNGQVAEFSHP
jgi:hypothetical protein